MDNLKSATKSQFMIYWGVEPDDRETILAAKDTGYPVVVNEGTPCYADAFQSIYEHSTEPVFLIGNDDFYFLDGWDVKPMEMLEKFPDIKVLGLHDGNPKTTYSSIQLIKRDYIKEQSGVVDMPNRVFYPYGHCFVDNEMTETAQKRGVWDRCDAPCIQHQHPSFTWLGEYPEDDTHRKNNARFAKDSETYHSRKHLWQ